MVWLSFSQIPSSLMSSGTAPDGNCSEMNCDLTLATGSTSIDTSAMQAPSITERVIVACGTRVDTVTLAGSEFRRSSLTLKRNASAPFSADPGMYLKAPVVLSTHSTRPRVGSSTHSNVTASWSTSSARKVPVYPAASNTVIELLSATGASLTGFTIISQSAGALFS